MPTEITVYYKFSSIIETKLYQNMDLCHLCNKINSFSVLRDTVIQLILILLLVKKKSQTGIIQ